MVRLHPMVALLCLLASLPAAAFNCGQKLVHEGDSRYDVRARCGEPADIEVTDHPAPADHLVLRAPVLAAPGSLVEVPVEIWTYNFGPNKLMRRLRFVDGELENIETLGYGYIK